MGRAHVTVGVLRAAVEVLREALDAFVADAEPFAVVLNLVPDRAEFECGVAGGEDALSKAACERSLASGQERKRPTWRVL